MKSPFTICYTSKSRPDLTEEEIKDVFSYTSNANDANNVKGILLHSFGNFFQVLEGEEAYLVDLYENKIKKDNRHTDLYEVFNKKSVKPVFGTYSSSFEILENSEQLDALKLYLDQNKASSTTSEKLSRLLKPFIVLED